VGKGCSNIQLVFTIRPHKCEDAPGLLIELHDSTLAIHKNSNNFVMYQT